MLADTQLCSRSRAAGCALAPPRGPTVNCAAERAPCYGWGKCQAVSMLLCNTQGIGHWPPAPRVVW